MRCAGYSLVTREAYSLIYWDLVAIGLRYWYVLSANLEVERYSWICGYACTGINYLGDHGAYGVDDLGCFLGCVGSLCLRCSLDDYICGIYLNRLVLVCVYDVLIDYCDVPIWGRYILA